jgi:hypothetical protein
MAMWMKNSCGNCSVGAPKTNGFDSWCPRRRASTWPGFPTTSPLSCNESMKTTPGGLVTLLATQGWPGQALVGEEGAQAAWLLAQHADRHPDLQRAFLDALRGAVAQGEASPAHLAYLEDRVRVHAGQPQLYGTQFTVTDGEFGPYPIEDPQRLDARRTEAGLEPFAASEARMRTQS